MVRVLNVAEKPSVAKGISEILAHGRPNRRNGLSPYNHIFEFGCQIRGENCDMIFTSVAGHLLELDFTTTHRAWHTCAPLDLFDAPVEKKVGRDKDALERQLKQEARGCQRLVLWLDCDREGENIAFEVIQVCRLANPRLQILRARFSALTPGQISHALNNLIAPDQNQADAVDARMEVDLRIGAAFTRFQTFRLQDRFEGIDGVLSYGPCQFPTLGFVVERHKRIESFVPEDYWYIKIEHGPPGSNKTTTFSWLRDRLFDRMAAVVIYSIVVQAGQARVVSVESKDTTRWRPVPLATVELQKRASRFLHMDSETTMKVAEELYTQGYISYPRTETEKFKPDQDLRALVQDQRNHPQWGAYAADLLDNNKFKFPRDGPKDDQAHPPIHPTKSVAPDNLARPEERRVYELVVRHFLACCSDDAKGHRTSVRIEMAGEEFTASGTVILQRNWLDVYNGWERWEEATLPPMQAGEVFVPRSVTLEQSRTRPPDLLSEADLIALMDTKGIGTDATIADHIGKIQERNYAYRGPDRRFAPTPLGLALVEGYDNIGYRMTKPDLRAKMEADCKKVARGQMRKEDMVRECLQVMKACFQDCLNNAAALDNSMARHFHRLGAAQAVVVQHHNFSRCGHCQGMLDLKRQEAVLFLHCRTCDRSHKLPRKRVPGKLDPPVMCVLCGYEAINMEPEPGAEGAAYAICPWCFSEPPDHSGIDFRCRSCTEVGRCPLAKKHVDADVPVMPCRGCKTESLMLRKTDKGFMLGCRGFPVCRGSIYLPEQATSVTVVRNSQCPRCSALQHKPVLLLRFELNTRSLPAGTERNIVACVLCNDLIREHSTERYPAPGSAGGAAVNHARGRGGAAAGRVPGRDDQPPPPAPRGRGTRDEGNRRVRGRGRAQGRGRGDDGDGGGTRGSGGGGGRRGSRGRGGRGKRRLFNGSDDDPEDPDENPRCPCGVPSRGPIAVRKEGPNQGRLFYSCANNPQCGFFAWDDERGGGGGARNSGGDGGRGGGRGARGQGRGRGRSRGWGTSNRSKRSRAEDVNANVNDFD